MTRRSYTAEFKAKVAPVALQGESTANEMAARRQAHLTLVSKWNHALLDDTV